ncbi:MAG TPA: hypothetical protein PLQ35_02160 [bacterium]|nr:hypothetical protein [bacterium]HQL61076.1 hypothetical protein [bacterium]
MNNIKTTGMWLALTFSATVWSYGSGSVSVDNYIQENMERITAGNRSLVGLSPSDLDDEETLRALLGYANNENPEIRTLVLSAVQGRSEKAVISVAIQGLKDKDAVVRQYAMRVLSECSVDALQKSDPDVTVRALEEHALEWDVLSHSAVLLLGRLGFESSKTSLRTLLEQAAELQTRMGLGKAVIPELDTEIRESLWRREGVWNYRMDLVPAMKDACLKALFRMNDEEASGIVLGALEGDDALSTTFAVEAVIYASRKDLLRNLLVLVKNDGEVKLEKYAWHLGAASPQYRRMCDIAIDAVVDLSDRPFSFRAAPPKPFRYSDEQIQEVRRYLESL